MMTDKVLCPWCGAEMRTITDPLEINGKTEAWNAWMVCKNFDCQAEGPFVQESTLEEAMDSAKAAALRRHTPPITAENKLVCPINGAPCSECKPGNPCAVVQSDA